MKLKPFKPVIAACIACLAATATCFAQDATVQAQPGTSTTITAQPAVPAQATIPAQPVAPQATASASSVPDADVVPFISVDTKGIKATVQDFEANTRVMVKTKTITIASVKVPVPAVTIAYNEPKHTYTTSTSTIQSGNQVNQVKNYSKIYPADGGDELVISNRYGDITVNTWDKNQFKVDVQISVEAGSPDDAGKVLDNVSIADAKNGSSVAFRTDIAQEGGSWLSWLVGNHSGHKLKIDYTVYMPARNQLTIENSYGAVHLPDLSGKVTIKCAYGALTAKSLTNESTIRASYSSVDLGALDATWIDISYGSLNVGTVNRIASNASYTAVKVAKINESGAFNLRYAGSFSIGDLDRNMKDLAINCSYSNVEIGLSGDENVNFNINVHYGDFDYGDRNITFAGKLPDDSKGFHPTKTYKGSLGKGSPDKNIAINSSYGNVKFN